MCTPEPEVRAVLVERFALERFVECRGDLWNAARQGMIWRHT
jgi:hypothetical protein